MIYLSTASPIAYPTAGVRAPADTDSPRASGALQTALQDAKDALDYLHGRSLYGARVNSDGTLGYSSARAGHAIAVERMSVGNYNVFVPYAHFGVVSFDPEILPGNYPMGYCGVSNMGLAGAMCWVQVRSTLTHSLIDYDFQIIAF